MERTKRILCALFALALALGAGAQAEALHSWPGSSDVPMLIVDCDEWVSLRAEPSQDSERLTKIYLYDTVTGDPNVDGQFVHCKTRDGMEGYVLYSYLKPFPFELLTAEDSTSGSEIWDSPAQFSERNWTLDFPKQGYSVQCAREYGDGEAIHVSCFDDANHFVWGLYTNACIAAELDGTSAFAGGTEEQPQVLVYNSFLGIASVDLVTGQLLWTMNSKDANLGGSLVSAVADDGTVYMGGFYGPDPVAISANGSVLWRSDVGDGSSWLHEITVEGDAVVAKYDYEMEYGSSKVWLDRDTGEVLRNEMSDE